MLQDYLLRNKDLAALAPAFREIEERLRALEAAARTHQKEEPVTDITNQEYRKRAEKQVENLDIHIPPLAMVSRAAGGAYVLAEVWVPEKETTATTPPWAKEAQVLSLRAQLEAMHLANEARTDVQAYSSAEFFALSRQLEELCVSA